MKEVFELDLVCSQNVNEAKITSSLLLSFPSLLGQSRLP